MAAAASPLPKSDNKSHVSQIIELSSDDENGNAALLPRHSKTESVTATPIREPVEAAPVKLAISDNDTAKELEQEAYEDEDDDFSDTDSFIRDLMFTDEDEDEDEVPYDGETCSPEEASEYKRRLRDIGPELFVAETIGRGVVSAKKLITAFGVRPPEMFEGSPDSRYWRMLGMLMTEEFSKRQKLPQYNTMDDVVQLLKTCSMIMVITGAGISTNLGIPDFRSPHSGFYAQMKQKGFSSPEDIFDLLVFDDDPRMFYENSGATFAPPGKTSPTHAFIALLQKHGKLMTNYTQNIDNIEASAGIARDKLIQCHGSWATATCRKCGSQVPGEEILPYVQAKKVAVCQLCVHRLNLPVDTLKRKRKGAGSREGSKHRKRNSDDDSDDEGQYDIPQPGIMKPDITFFHEALPATFFERFNGHDKKAADLVIVIGTSLKVAPVSEIPMALPADVPQIFISRDMCGHTAFDVTLLGDCDTVCGELARRLGWDFKHPMLPENQRVTISPSDKDDAAWLVIPVKGSTPAAS